MSVIIYRFNIMWNVRVRSGTRSDVESSAAGNFFFFFRDRRKGGEERGGKVLLHTLREYFVFERHARARSTRGRRREKRAETYARKKKKRGVSIRPNFVRKPIRAERVRHGRAPPNSRKRHLEEKAKKRERKKKRFDCFLLKLFFLQTLAYRVPVRHESDVARDSGRFSVVRYVRHVRAVVRNR